MKRKLTGIVSLLVISLTMLGTFGSCKDYDEDLKSDMQGLLDAQAKASAKSLTDSIKAQKDSLNKLRDDLNETLDAFVTIEELPGAIAGNQEVKDAFTDAITAVIGADASTLGTTIAGINVAVANANSRIDSLAQADSLHYKHLLQITTDLNTEITKTNSALGVVKTDLQNLTTRVDSISNALHNRIDSVDQALSNRITALNTAINARVDSVANVVSALETRTTNLENRFQVLEGRLDNVADSVAKLWAQVTADTAWIHAFTAAYSKDTANINSQLAQLMNSDLELLDMIEQTNKDMTKLINSIVNRLDDLESDLNNRVDSTNLTLAELKSRIETIEASDKVIRDSLKTLDSKIETLSTQVNANTTKINLLTSRVNGLEDALKKMITGVIIQATENPVFGSFALPLDIRSNVLMAYYGDAEGGDRLFPAIDGKSSYEYNNQMVLTEVDARTLANAVTFAVTDGTTMMDTNAGNAGNLYLTVNPTSVDFTGATFELVNSQDKKSGVVLSNLEKTDKVLTFGYTRAASNGFYVAKATLDPAKVKDVKINIEPGLKSDLGQLLRDFRDRKKTVSLTSLITNIYNQFNGILDANGVKAAWADSLGDHAVYSQYNVAATAFKPLSYKFLYDKDLSKFNIPQFNKIGYVDLGLKDFDIKIELDSIKLNSDMDIQFTEVSFDVDEMKIDVIVDVSTIVKQPVFDENGDLVVDEENNPVFEDKEIVIQDTVPVDLTKDMKDFADKLAGQFNDQIAGDMSDQINSEINRQLSQIETTINETLQGMIGNINDQLDDVNDLIGQFNGYQDKANSYIDRVNSYINRLNSFTTRINNYINNANHYLQTTVLYDNGKGELHQLSASPVMPSFMSKTAAAVLHTTSYTAELAAPASKKFIAVTRVKCNGTWRTDLAKEANEANAEFFNKVLAGKTKAVKFVLPSSAHKGDLYEIVYSGLDYSGYTSTRKYYISVTD